MINNELIEKLRSSKTQFISIISGKGGTGKTIITASLGYILSSIGFKTLLVDLDMFTGGLTYYALTNVPPKKVHNFSLLDILLDKAKLDGIKPIALPFQFAEGRLFLLPSIAKKKRVDAELHLKESYQSIDGFCNKMLGILDEINKDNEFDFILLDTRGGTDYSSVGAALIADGYILVSEADRISWHTSEQLIETIKIASEENEIQDLPYGFIINKSVISIDNEDINRFLEINLGCPHLVTIPLDINITKYFQLSKIPVAEDTNSQFTESLITVIKETTQPETWSNTQQEYLKIQEEKNWLEKKARERINNHTRAISRFSVVKRIYVSIVLLGMLSILLLQKLSGILTKYDVLVLVISLILVLLDLWSEPNILSKLVPLLKYKGKTKNDNKTKQ